MVGEGRRSQGVLRSARSFRSPPPFETFLRFAIQRNPAFMPGVAGAFATQKPYVTRVQENSPGHRNFHTSFPGSTKVFEKPSIGIHVTFCVGVAHSHILDNPNQERSLSTNNKKQTTRFRQQKTPLPVSVHNIGACRRF